MKAIFQTSNPFQSPPDRFLLGGLLCAWMGAIVLLDLVVMPSLYFTGMMQQVDFAGAGYAIFGTFSNVEMLMSGLVLSLVLWRIKVSQGGSPGLQSVANPSMAKSGSNHNSLWLLASLLLLVCCLVSSILVPQMSALSLPLDGGFDRVIREPDETMNWFHGLYWTLDALKVFAAGLLVWML
jgi:hypothetical protein